MARGLLTTLGVSGPVERMGAVEEKPAKSSGSLEREQSRPRSNYSLAFAILALGFVIVAVILAGTFAYHRLFKTPEEVAKDLAREVANGVKEVFNVTPRVTVNQVVVIHESSPSFELATVTRETTASYEYKNSSIFGDKTLTLSGHFRIKAGFDLSTASALEVQPHPLKIVAQFPPPKILSVEMTSYDVHQSDDHWWRRLTPEEQKAALDTLKRTATVEGGAGINTEAKKNLEEKLRSLVDQKKAPIEFQYGLKK
jgi:hypothetical protein